MNLTRLTLLLLVLFAANFVAAQESESDSSRTDSLKDSVVVVDSLKPGDEILDELTESQRKLLDMGRRLEEFKAARQLLPRLSFYDSLITYFASERFNRRKQIDRSVYFDAGDYFKFDPSFMIWDYQTVPLRKTVQPFGLSGSRLNIFSNGYQHQPFEHIIEPDGMTDMNDIPTALDGNIYIIPGALGQFLGGRQPAATLLTTPLKTEDDQPATILLADKGWYGYDYVRGGYSRKFASGRQISFFLGSRDTDGVVFGRGDDNSHYKASVYLPLTDNMAIISAGQMYERDAAFVVRPGLSTLPFTRKRFDRSFRTALEFQNDSRTSRAEIGYEHLRQGSYLDFAYKGRFNRTGHGSFFKYEKADGSKLWQLESRANILEYDNGFGQFDRFSASFFVNMLKLNESGKFGIRAGSYYSDDYNFMPSIATLYQFESDKFFVQLSASYSENEPSLHQLNLPYQEADIFGTFGWNYAEGGTPNLKKERLLVGNLIIEPGTVENKITLSITGGRISNVIEWTDQFLPGAGSPKFYSPVNDNLTFYTASVKPSLRLSDFLRFDAGGAYFKFDYDTLGVRPYRPEYNLFSGLELHYYWKSRLVNLYAYGELRYVGPYDGYDKTGLGEELVANTKFTIGLHNFSFHLVFQNHFDNQYELRENLTVPGRVFYYGLVWKFYD
ncbi:MAG: hypothetical protein IIC66_00015 [candidate division Zixibacteria bacterium]|nr:hypothetical protein [candidate division Zixibacteria bacterium]